MNVVAQQILVSVTQGHHPFETEHNQKYYIAPGNMCEDVI